MTVSARTWRTGREKSQADLVPPSFHLLPEFPILAVVSSLTEQPQLTKLLQIVNRTSTLLTHVPWLFLEGPLIEIPEGAIPHYLTASQLSTAAPTGKGVVRLHSFPDPDTIQSLSTVHGLCQEVLVTGALNRFKSGRRWSQINHLALFRNYDWVVFPAENSFQVGRLIGLGSNVLALLYPREKVEIVPIGVDDQSRR